MLQWDRPIKTPKEVLHGSSCQIRKVQTKENIWSLQRQLKETKNPLFLWNMFSASEAGRTPLVRSFIH